MKSDYKIGCTKCGKYLEGKMEAGVFDIAVITDKDHPDILQKICTCKTETISEKVPSAEKPQLVIEWDPIIQDLEMIMDAVASKDNDLAMKKLQEMSKAVKDLRKKSDQNEN